MKKGTQESLFTVFASMVAGLLVVLAMFYVGLELLW